MVSDVRPELSTAWGPRSCPLRQPAIGRWRKTSRASIGTHGGQRPRCILYDAFPVELTEAISRR